MCLLGLTYDTVLIEYAGIQEVCQYLASAPNIEVQVLVHGHLLEQQVMPVVVREQVWVGSLACLGNAVFAVIRGICVAHSLSLVVGCFIEHLHISRSVSHWLYHCGRRERVVQPNFHLHLLRQLTLLSVHYDNAIGTARTI